MNYFSVTRIELFYDNIVITWTIQYSFVLLKKNTSIHKLQLQTMKQLNFHVHCHSRGSPVSLMTLSLLLCWKQCNILTLSYKRKNYFPAIYMDIVSTNHTIVDFSRSFSLKLGRPVSLIKLRCYYVGNNVIFWLFYIKEKTIFLEFISTQCSDRTLSMYIKYLVKNLISWVLYQHI